MNLATILGMVSALPQLLTLVSETVKEIETVFVGSPGATKFAAAEAKVNSVLAAVTTDAQKLSELQAVSAPLINSAVAMYRAAGVFKASASAPSVKSSSLLAPPLNPPVPVAAFGAGSSVTP